MQCNSNVFLWGVEHMFALLLLDLVNYLEHQNYHEQRFGKTEIFNLQFCCLGK